MTQDFLAQEEEKSVIERKTETKKESRQIGEKEEH